MTWRRWVSPFCCGTFRSFSGELFKIAGCHLIRSLFYTTMMLCPGTLLPTKTSPELTLLQKMFWLQSFLKTSQTSTSTMELDSYLGQRLVKCLVLVFSFFGRGLVQDGLDFSVYLKTHPLPTTATVGPWFDSRIRLKALLEQYAASDQKLHISSSWWFQTTPLKKMLVKMGSSSPKIGVKIKHIWNHHIVIYSYLGLASSMLGKSSKHILPNGGEKWWWIPW